MADALRILELSRRYRDYTASNLSELVKIKSFSCGEKEVAHKLAEQMKAARLDEVTIGGLGNVIGRFGRGLASHIEVPAVHVEEKRVNPTMPEELSQGKPVPALLRIHSSAEKPGEAFIAFPYREHWFWIDDRDMASKSLFTFLTFIFSLTETGGGKEGAPVITIPGG